MSAAPVYRLELLDPRRHDRRGFSCGEGELDIYLRRTASTDAERKTTVVYVLASEAERDRIAGYLTLSMAKVALTGVPKATLTGVADEALIGISNEALTGASTAALTGVPEAARGRLTHRPLAPATLIGRLAVAESLQGVGLGARLLQEAFIKAVEATSQVASCAVIVDPLHERAAAFYRRYGFAPIGDGQRMYLPMRTVVASLVAATATETSN